MVTDINYRLNLFIFFLSRCSALNVQSFFPLIFFLRKESVTQKGQPREQKKLFTYMKGTRAYKPNKDD